MYMLYDLLEIEEFLLLLIHIFIYEGDICFVLNTCKYKEKIKTTVFFIKYYLKMQNML